MSGVRHGTRLEQLEALQRATRLQRAYARWAGNQAEHDRLDALVTRLDHEIAQERPRRPEVAAAVRRTDNAVTLHLQALGVTALDVKRWAVETGLIPAVVRGRISAALVDAYDHAHQRTGSCACGCPDYIHIGEIGCPCGMPDEMPCAERAGASTHDPKQEQTT